MKLYRLLYLTIAAVMLVSCQDSKHTHIKIVCTSDVHGNLFPYDFLTGDSLGGSLARVSNYLKEQQRKGVDIVYVDNGDMLQGTPATYCYNTYAIAQTHVAAEALNYLGCEAVVLGNNDIEPGGPTYQRYADELGCAVLGGNILFEGGTTPFLPPYTVVEREGVKIAILGLTTPAIPHWIPKCQWQELCFGDMEHSARRWMQHLYENVQPDIVIGLFHSGYEGGIVTDDCVENATRLVTERVPGFDAIFYGHDHRPRIAEVVNVAGDTILLLNPGRDAHQVATIDVVLNQEGGATLSASLVDMNGYAPDEDYMKTFTPHMERIEKYVNRTVAVSECAATTQDVLYGPSALVDFIHQMQLDVSNAKVSFAAPMTRETQIPEGEVTVGDIYRFLPYENMLYVIWMTGREIKNYLELSYDKWIEQLGMQDESQYFDSAAGIVYEVDTTRSMGERVSIKCMADGAPFALDERYMVVMNSYRAHGGGCLMTEGAGIGHELLLERMVYSTTADIRFYMLNYVEMRDTIAPHTLGQWRFVP